MSADLCSLSSLKGKPFGKSFRISFVIGYQISHSKSQPVTHPGIRFTQASLAKVVYGARNHFYLSNKNCP